MSASFNQSGNSYASGGNINITTIQNSITATNADFTKMKIVNWLFDIAVVNHYAIQTETYTKVAPGTAAWITERPEFNAWLSGKSKYLWGTGIPGAGKTFLTSFVVNYLEQHLMGTGGNVLFAYSRFNSELTVAKILAALLGQLAESSNLALSYLIQNLYDPSISKRIVTPPEEILAIHLKAAVNLVSTRTFVLVDALDELQDNIRENLVDILLGLKCPIFLTSRELSLESLRTPAIRIQAPGDDFRTFITGEVQHLPKLWSLLKNRKEVMEEMIRNITAKSDGMFLLAALQLSALGGITSIKNLRKAVSKLPSTLTDMYALNLERIMNQQEEEHSLACRAILWVAYAGQPLKTPELLEALALEPGSDELDPDARTSETTLRSICCGLLNIEEGTDTVRFIHYTTYDFFRSQKSGLFKRPHTFAANICAEYLDLSDICNRQVATWDELKAFTQSHPLADYACRYLGYHMRHSMDEHDETNHVHHILSARSPVLLAPIADWTQIIHYGSITHFAALHGISSMIGRQGLNDKSFNGCTPLYYASMNGHVPVVELILDAAGVDVNRQNMRGQTALFAASKYGHKAVVQLLLSFLGIDIHQTDENCSTPLHSAAINGHEAIIHLLLDHPGVDINAQDENGYTALYYASFYGHEAAVKLLLSSPDVDVNLLDKCGYNALHRASLNPHEGVVEQLLVSPKTDINAKSMSGESSLYIASLHGHMAVVRLLLRSINIDVNLQNGREKTALQAASSCGHQEIVKLLLGYPGVDVNIRDKYGHTALHVASSQGYEGVVKLLCHHPGIVADIKDHKGDSPLSLAYKKGHDRVVQLLSDRSIRCI